MAWIELEGARQLPEQRLNEKQRERIRGKIDFKNFIRKFTTSYKEIKSGICFIILCRIDSYQEILFKNEEFPEPCKKTFYI